MDNSTFNLLNTSTAYHSSCIIVHGNENCFEKVGKQTFTAEMHFAILSNLDEENYNNTLLVSKKWKDRTLEYSISINIPKIKKFIDFLFFPPKIVYEENGENKKRFENIMNTYYYNAKPFESCSSLKEINYKNSIDVIFNKFSEPEQDLIFNVENNNFKEALKSLDKENKSLFIKNITNIDSFKRNYDLGIFSKLELVCVDNEEVNNTLTDNFIPDSYYFNNMEKRNLIDIDVESFSSILASFNKIFQSLKIANLTKDIDNKERLFMLIFNISLSLNKNEITDNLFNFFKLMNEESYFKKTIIHKYIMTSINKNEWENCAKLIEFYDNNKRKEVFYVFLFRNMMIYQNKYIESYFMSKLIPNLALRDKVYEYTTIAPNLIRDVEAYKQIICQNIVNINDVEKSKEYFSLIKDINKSSICMEIAKDWIVLGLIHDGIKILEIIPNSPEKCEMITDIAKYLVNLTKIDEAKEIINLIHSDTIYNYSLNS